jgi:hypothetical protein
MSCFGDIYCCAGVYLYPALRMFTAVQCDVHRSARIFTTAQFCTLYPALFVFVFCSCLQCIRLQ